MREILEVSRQIEKRGAAMVASDLEAIEELLDERLIYTHSSGLVDTRDSYVDALRKREYIYHYVNTVQEDYSIADSQQVIINSVMQVAMTVKSSGERLSRKIRVTEIWVRSNIPSDWKLLVSHSTNIA